MFKYCRKCLTVKPIDEFYTHPQMKDGRLNKCKECTKADVRENRVANVEYYRQYDRKRFDQHGARGVASDESKRRATIAWANKHAEQKKAQTAVHNAVRDGRLLKPSTCSKCGAIGKIEGHHHDYSKPFDVEWLCKKCHGQTWRKPRLKIEPRKKGGHVGQMQPTRAKAA